MNTPVRDVLILAKRLVENGWSQGTSARMADGSPIALIRSEAVSFCAIGAINRAYYELFGFTSNYTGEVEIAIRLMEKALPGRARCIETFNDARNRRKEAILALFDRAIASAQENN